MTGEQFRSTYKLLKVVTERGVQSHHAVSPKGRVVMVHFMVAAPDENRRLLGLVARLGTADRARILDTLDVDGSTVLVTEFIQGFKTLATWLEAKAQPAPPPTASVLSPPPPHQPPPPSPAAPGEFTRMFGAEVAAAALRDTPTPPNVEERAPPAAPQSSTPGEFTRLFAAASGDASAPASGAEPSGEMPPTMSPPPAPPPPPERAADRRPVVRWKEQPAKPDGEDRDKPIVRWKKESPGAAAPSAPVAPAPPPKQAGEFTRLFGAIGAEPPTVPPPAAAVPPVGSEGAGEFTSFFNPVTDPPPGPLGGAESSSERLLRALDAPATPGTTVPSNPAPLGSSAPAPNLSAPPGEFTRMLSGIPAAGPAPGGGAGAGPGPSEFTRLVAAAQPARVAPPPPAQVAAPARGPATDEPGPRPLLPLILAAAALVLLVAVALYFVLR